MNDKPIMRDPMDSEPLAKEGVCCDQCDMDKVIPKRIEEHNNGGQV